MKVFLEKLSILMRLELDTPLNLYLSLIDQMMSFVVI